MQSPLGFFFAFVVVLALIGAAAWLVRRFAGNRLGATAKGGRLPRLAVIDATAVDGRRRLVLVRRDNVEHLLMIGGPTDIVVEPNIVRAAPARDQSRSPSLPDPASWAENDPPRAESLDFNEPPMAEPPPQRPQRPSFVEDARRTPPAMPERRERSDARNDSLGGFAPEPMVRPSPDMRPAPEIRPDPPSRPARSEPMMPRPVRSAEPPPVKAPAMRAERPAPAAPAPAAATAAESSADQNLAEMAQRLEAALRRPGGDPRPSPPITQPMTQPMAQPMSQPMSPPMAPDANAGRTARVSISDIKIEPVAAAETAPPVAPPRASFEDLEEEMASLLGRPKNTT